MIKILYRVKILLIRMHKIETNIITEFITFIVHTNRQYSLYRQRDNIHCTDKETIFIVQTKRQYSLYRQTYSLYRQTVFIVQTNSIHCTGKQYSLYKQTVFIVQTNSIYCTDKQT